MLARSVELGVADGEDAAVDLQRHAAADRQPVAAPCGAGPRRDAGQPYDPLAVAAQRIVAAETVGEIGVGPPLDAAQGRRREVEVVDQAGEHEVAGRRLEAHRAALLRRRPWNRRSRHRRSRHLGNRRQGHRGGQLAAGMGGAEDVDHQAAGAAGEARLDVVEGRPSKSIRGAVTVPW